MDKELKTKEKTCAFYVSDYHFEMITLPYMYKNLESKKDVVILTENNLKDTVKVLLDRMNFKDNKKEEILNLDWEDNDLKKFRKIKSNIEENRNTVVFIKGKENYIKNANQNLEKWLVGNDNLQVIDCYDIEEVGNKLDEVKGKYTKLLKTAGEEKIV